MASFSDTAFSTGAFDTGAFDFGSGGTPPAAAPAGPTPAGRSSGRYEPRRRYVLPDGRMVTATEAEISYLLRKFLVTEEQRITPRSGGRRFKKSIVRTPAVIEEADIEWQRLSGGPEPVYAPVLPQGLVWAPSPEDLQSALAAFAARRRAEEETAISLLLLH